ncbi:DNA repair protein RAD51 homolog 4 isoform X1 [Amaranthus tricolor]|uniref:DNA repair protein RAD51 homolog 4 isoform X1 n=1 Tax=Amaranthus tricolor TaxID=29722 RepID=UPI0025862BB6|nr:DNA repair protein RAD51 homolog 4 isoform X1 [Amaranthus tricolor]
MGLLKSMEDEYPLIDSIFQEFCGSRGIFTVEDFLIHDLNALISFAEKQPYSERLIQGIDQLLSVVNGLHKPWLNGVELLKDAQQNKHTFAVAFEEDDPILYGAFREGFITELVGQSCSGKTQVCLLAAASVAKGYAGCVVFIDSGNSFSAQRIAHFVNQDSSFAPKQGNIEALDVIMMKILCYSAFDIFSLFDVLHQLEMKLKNQICSVRLLIVDSFSSLIIPLLGGNGPYSHALMISAASLLKKIAHEYHVCVLVTNHMVAGEGGTSKPALGESWKSIPHVRLLLSRDRESNTISVIRHPSMAAGTQVKFRISNS